MTTPNQYTQFAIVPELFTRGLMRAPATLRCYVSRAALDRLVETASDTTLLEAQKTRFQSSSASLLPLAATLLADGSVAFLGDVYADIEAARLAALPQEHSSSTAWQFWLHFDGHRQAWSPLEHQRAALVYGHHSAQAQTLEPIIKTSQKYPLRIDAVAYPHSGVNSAGNHNTDSVGQIGMTFCPGKCATGLYGGTWARDLREDLNVIARWAPLALISLLAPAEFELLQVAHFPDLVLTHDFQWLSLPIPDMQTPGADFERQWLGFAPGLHSALRDGGRIVVHCRGGLGRTGVVAARLLIEAGLSPSEAIRQVRATRLGAIETYAQEYYLLSRAWMG